MLHEIDSIIVEEYDGTVYNLETGDNTYATAAAIVHNCSPQDESVAFLPLALIQKCCTLQRNSISADSVFAGIDVGRFHDLTAVEIFAESDDGYYHIDEILMRNTEIPLQVEYIKNLDYNFENINVDMTGMGLGLYEYLKDEMPCNGITFTKQMKVEMAVNLRNLMQDNRVKLLDDRDLISDLHSIQYNTMDAARTKLGHGDRTWAVALALYKRDDMFIEPTMFGGRIG